jgi:ADP-ribose pyrophosphatase YjhB (NUDIX family)
VLGGKVVGVNITCERDDENEINVFYVDLDYHRQGIGTKLLGYALSELDPSKKVIVKVASYNSNAINFYEKFGFEIVGPFDDPDGKLPNGKVIPEIKMIKKHDHQNRVRAVIIKDKRILTLERYKGEEHFWTFPGGGVEDGETEIEALTRECMEEVSVKVEVGQKIYYQDFNGHDINFYLCTITDGKVAKGDGPEYQKGTGYIGTHQPAWLPIEDLQKYDLRPSELRDEIIAKKYE